MESTLRWPICDDCDRGVHECLTCCGCSCVHRHDSTCGCRTSPASAAWVNVPLQRAPDPAVEPPTPTPAAFVSVPRRLLDTLVLVVTAARA